MKNQFFIKKGSFCFIVPFFTENSSVCNTYFKDLKNEIKQLEQKVTNENLKRVERKKIIKELKEKFISQIRTDYFPDIKPNLKTRFCDEIKSGGGNYNGRFLCKCMSSAVKFHDDISQQKNAAQFFWTVSKSYIIMVNLNAVLISTPYYILCMKIKKRQHICLLK